MRVDYRSVRRTVNHWKPELQRRVELLVFHLESLVIDVFGPNPDIHLWSDEENRAASETFIQDLIDAGLAVRTDDPTTPLANGTFAAFSRSKVTKQETGSPHNIVHVDFQCKTRS